MSVPDDDALLRAACELVHALEQGHNVADRETNVGVLIRMRAGREPTARELLDMINDHGLVVAPDADLPDGVEPMKASDVWDVVVNGN